MQCMLHLKIVVFDIICEWRTHWRVSKFGAAKIDQRLRLIAAPAVPVSTCCSYGQHHHVLQRHNWWWPLGLRLLWAGCRQNSKRQQKTFGLWALGEKGFGYKGSSFHSFIPEFMDQGSDVTYHNGIGPDLSIERNLRLRASSSCILVRASCPWQMLNHSMFCVLVAGIVFQICTVYGWMACRPWEGEWRHGHWGSILGSGMARSVRRSPLSSVDNSNSNSFD